MYSTVNPAPVISRVARPDLAARIADARRDTAAAIAAWTAAATAEDKVGYGEPPDWLFPAREGLGAALMRAGKAAEAEKVFAPTSCTYRKNPRSLFGLWKALEQQTKTAEAAKAKAEFDASWSGADVTLDEAAFRKGA